MTKTLSGCVHILWGSLLIPVVALAHPIPPTINTTPSGRITDQRTGEPLIGATVLIKNTTNGGTAGTNGLFTLKTGQKLPLPLIISFIGYQPKEIIAEGIPRGNEPLYVIDGLQKAIRT